MTRVPSSIARELMPLVLVAAVYPWLVICIRNCLDAMPGRDPNMFSYAAWCFRHGERMYVDYATPDGPLIIVLQAILQAVCGTTAHALRGGDLVFQAGCGATVGALIVPAAGDRLHNMIRRTTWGIVGGTVWLVELLGLGWDYALQRESYYVGIGLVALTLGYSAARRSPRVAGVVLGAAGFLVGINMFGKHTGVLYVALLLLLAWLVRASLARRLRVLATIGGALLGVAVMLALVALTGSVHGFWFWYWHYDIDVYRFVLLVPYDDLLAQADRRPFFASAGFALIGGVAALRLRFVPPAFAAFALGPMIHIGAAIAQRRGWDYHYLPAYTSATVCILGLMGLAWCRVRGERRGDVRDLAGVLVFVFFAVRFQSDAVGAAFLDKTQMHRTSPEENVPYQAADFLSHHTKSTDRVFLFWWRSGRSICRGSAARIAVYRRVAGRLPALSSRLRATHGHTR
jgi:hypothetical protein